VLRDSHCHLADEAFVPDLEAVVSRARAAGVTAALCMLDAGDEAELNRAGRLTALWPEVAFGVGVHPHQAGSHAGRLGEVAALVEQRLRETPAARAIGEIGLDFHYDVSPRNVQYAVLAAQVDLAARLDRPIVIHAREAEDEVLAVLREHGRGRLRGVFHCYTGDVPTATRVLDLGFHLGIGGIVTFPRGENVRSLLAHVPLDRVLLETDSPFLAPVPHRGKRNEPAWVARVAEVVASVVGRPLEAVAGRTTRTFEALFPA
jgi:TatD DNase family protein